MEPILRPSRTRSRVVASAKPSGYLMICTLLALDWTNEVSTAILSLAAIWTDPLLHPHTLRIHFHTAHGQASYSCWFFDRRKVFSFPDRDCCWSVCRKNNPCTQLASPYGPAALFPPHEVLGRITLALAQGSTTR